MTKTGYTIAMIVTSLILVGSVYGSALFLSRVWTEGTPLVLATLATTLLAALITLLVAALWMFGRERREA